MCILASAPVIPQSFSDDALLEQALKDLHKLNQAIIERMKAKNGLN
jgi:hypothetical protein